MTIKRLVTVMAMVLALCAVRSARAGSCSSDSDCGGYGKCSSGQCGACGSDSDCNGHGRCSSGKCGSCGSGSDCKEGRCSGGKCGSCGSDSPLKGQRPLSCREGGSPGPHTRTSG